MRRTIARLLATALIGSAGLAAAQTATETADQTPVKRTTTPEQKYAACLSKHGNQPRQRQACEDKYIAANVKASKKAEKAQAQAEKAQAHLERKMAKQARERRP
jgi:hypothetical protein